MIDKCLYLHVVAGDVEGSGSMADISEVGPGAYGVGVDPAVLGAMPAYMERMTTDIGALKKQYSKLRERQNQAHIILAGNKRPF